METVCIVVWVIYLIIAWVLYHKIFDVVYFDLKQGCIGELVGCGFVSGILAYCTFHFWKISMLIVLVACIIAFFCCKTAESKAMVVIAGIILLIILALLGNKFVDYEKNGDEQQSALNTTRQEFLIEDISLSL